MHVHFRRSSSFRTTFALLLTLGFLVSGCATVPPASDPQALAEFNKRNDPWEPTNRAINDFNQGVDTVILKPLAQIYHFILPDFIERRITHIFNNAAEPWTFVNDLLQGEGHRAGITFKRFLTNSTVGLAGMFDVAEKQGLKQHKEDFGQTLAVWGVHSGPYLVLPLLGPSDVRDAFGRGVDIIADPVGFAETKAHVSGMVEGIYGVEVLDYRARNLDLIDRIKSESIDYYATLRSAYRQDRAAEIRNGAPPKNEDNDEFFEDFKDIDGSSSKSPDE